MDSILEYRCFSIMFLFPFNLLPKIYIQTTFAHFVNLDP